MGSQEHNMVVLGQIVKLIPKKLIEKLKNQHKIQTRSFSATSHVIAMIFAQLSHALSLNDICDCQGLPVSDSGLCSAEQEWSGSCEHDPGCRTCGRIILGSIG